MPSTGDPFFAYFVPRIVSYLRRKGLFRQVIHAMDQALPAMLGWMIRRSGMMDARYLPIMRTFRFGELTQYGQRQLTTAWLGSSRIAVRKTKAAGRLLPVN